MTQINDFPPEILRKCFHSLSPSDLKSSVLVSEKWRAVGEDPSLWTWCQVTIRNREDLNKLSVRRMRKIQKIRILSGPKWGDEDWEALCQVVASEELPQLGEVDLRTWGSGLRTEHSTSILIRIALEDIKLKKLNLSGNGLSKVEPEVVVRAMIKLEEMNLGSTYLRTEQMSSILTRIAQEDIQLKKLNLYENDLSEVEPEVVVRAMIKLEEVDLGETDLRIEQMTSILTRIARKDTKLRRFNLYGNDLSEVEPEVLDRAVVKLEEVDLSYINLSTEQMTSILIRIAEKDIKLKKLNLHGDDLSEVEPEVLARAVVKLGELNLSRTKLRTEQMTSILTRIAEQDTNLKKLNLYGNDLSEVEPEVLAGAVVKLEEVYLCDTNLSTEQSTSVFTTLRNLEEMDMADTELTTEQMTSILTRISEDDIKLKKFYLNGNDLYDVEPEVLARAVVKLGSGLVRY